MNNLIISGILCHFFIFGSLFAQTTGDYRTATTSVAWTTAGNWQTWNGSQWISASSPPGSSSNVYVQAGHTATLSGNESCHSLFISSGTSDASTGGDGRLALQSNTLSINGKLSCYIGTINTTVNSTNPLSVTAENTTPILPISKTSGGKLKFVGNSRHLTANGEWGANASGSNSLFDIEIALNIGQTGTLNTVIKAVNWLISSGTLETSLRIAADNNTAGQGNITINEGATFSTSESTTPAISSTASDRCGTVTINGTLKLSGLNPFIECSAYSFGTNGTVEYSRSNSTGNQNFIRCSFSGAVNLLSYQHLILSGIGTKSTPDSLTTTIAANGSLSMSGGILAIGSGGAFSVSSSGTTLIYSGSSLQTATNTEWNSNFQNLSINNSSGVSLGSLTKTINGTLALISGAVSNCANITLGNGATIIRTGGTLSTPLNFGTSVNVSYNNYSGSISTGNELPSNSSVLNNLTINNSNGLTLSAARTINGTLTFSSGILTTTSTNLLTIETSGSVSGVSNSSFISGPVLKKTNSTSLFTFPTGKGNILRTISVSPSNTNATSYTAEYFNTPYTDTSTFTSPIKRVSKVDYFILTRSGTGTPSDAILNFEWGNNSGVNTLNVGELTMARFAGGSTWVNEAATGSGNSTSGVITSNVAVAAFGIFALANGGTNTNLLPVKFLYFRQDNNKQLTVLEWATATEINCLGFEIQKSEDGVSFSTLDFVKSKAVSGNSTQNMYYTFTGPLPEGTISYYRLKQLDYNGEFEYSPIIAVLPSDNPYFKIIHKTLHIYNPRKINNTFEITDIYGRVLHRDIFKNTYSLELQNFPCGLYYLRINDSWPFRFFNE